MLMIYGIDYELKERVDFTINDNSANIESLKQIVKRFVKERDWEQYHNLKDLSVAITIESTELMEHFLWRDSTETLSVLDNNKVEIENEVADIAILLFDFCNIAKIDLSNAVLTKLEINKEKYPVKLFKGKANKYNKLGEKDA